MQGKALEIAIGDIGHVTINDADTVLNRIDGMKDLNAIIAAMTGRLYHGTEAVDSLRVAALRNRLRASKVANHAKQARIIALESSLASKLAPSQSLITWMQTRIDSLRRDMQESDDARAEQKTEIARLESELAQSHSVNENYRRTLGDVDKQFKEARADAERLRAELKRLTTPTVTLTDNITPALQAVADDETMLREMAAEDAMTRRAASERAARLTDEIVDKAFGMMADAAARELPLPILKTSDCEDAARPTPVTEDIIKEAAAILGDPPLSDADAAKMHDAMRADVGESPAVVTADNGAKAPRITPDAIEWAPCARKALQQELARRCGINIPEADVLAWPVHQCVTSRCYMDGILQAIPTFLAHYAP